VQEGIADKFVEAFTKGMSEKINELAPLADKTQLSRVSSFFQRDAGKTQILVGGKQHGDKGCYWEPTVFYNPEKNAQVYNEEIFGPVACISTFKDEEEFLRLANDTEYGLMAGVFTQDINRAMRISSELDSGVVGINCVSTISLQTPFGGSKQSGIGREMSHYALRSYSEPKTVLIK
jgi:acyl-CoA reductase-like NAD-dependent aldehyde dehydrogenase